MKTAAVEQRMKPVALVVDDNWLTQTLVRRELEKRGFAVFEARTSAEAVRGYKRHQPAVVTLDLDRVDGRAQEIAEALVAAAPKANIVAVTSEVLPAFRDHLLNIGVRDIVIKPYDNPESVVSAVQATLESSPATSLPQTLPIASMQSRRWQKHMESAALATAREILLTIGGPELQVLPPDSSRSSGATFSTSSDVMGVWEGTIRVRFDKKLANELTARMFDADARRLKRGQIQDALIEVTNMIVGNLKSSLPGTSNYTIPEFLSNSSIRSARLPEDSSDPIQVGTEQVLCRFASRRVQGKRLFRRTQQHTAIGSRGDVVCLSQGRLFWAGREPRLQRVPGPVSAVYGQPNYPARSVPEAP